ncbi:glycosyltransferase family 2 protein [Nocardioides sp. SYSU D00038]|uniref:glycosyltransferase family 2 protein n=1 Tax=Nocardioides sp. SYSU D00038 TaxID=2812554 RepID=UPI00196828AC|nr:glycosyltransferase family 2 protein [Nocardioides sp. SYSU D00038]
MDVSVVIPCRNAVRTIGAQLDALAAQVTGATFEVVVADNGSTDGTRELLAARDDVVVVDAGARPGINRARNAGIAAARGDLLLLTDADDVVDPGWIEAYWQAARAGATLMGGPLRRVLPDGTTVRWQRRFTDSLGFLPWPTGANCALAREVVDACGPFDEELLGGGDETDLFWRAQLAGHVLVYVPGAVVSYTQRATLGTLFRQCRGYGRSHVRLFVRYRPHGMPRRRGRATLRLLGRRLREVAGRDGRRVALRALTQELGLAAGRLEESLRSRTLYL